MGDMNETSTTGAQRKREQNNSGRRSTSRPAGQRINKKVQIHLEVYHDDLREIDNWMTKNLKALQGFTGIQSKVISMTLTEKE
jgi:hypothetical protein